jgi:3-oxoacyl-[acyl-carrier protein] reductase
VSAASRAVAMQLALFGSYVIVGLPAESKEDEHALNELKSLGTLANAVKADISTLEGAKFLVAEVEKMFGRIDLLVNCLKLETDSAFEETSENIFETAVNANLKSAFFITQEALKLMKPRPKPKIVNLVSAIDTPETEVNVLFSTMQNAVVGLTKSLAKSLPKNFRVNAVAVSEKQTGAENLDTEPFRAKKGISEDDVARTIVYLLSGEAIGLNGQVLTVE